MKDRTQGLWDRAVKALDIAGKVLSIDPNLTASRAYYAAFYAVSARFAREGRFFATHKAVEIAVHRDLVKAKLWPTDLGAGFSRLMAVRLTADYASEEEVTPSSATDAMEIAQAILKAVSAEDPASFPLPG